MSIVNMVHRPGGREILVGLPAKDDFVDGEHDRRVRDDAHEVCTKATIQRLGTLFAYNKAKGLNEARIFDLAVHQGLS